MKKIFSFASLSVFCLLISDLGFSQDENYDAVYLQLKKEYTLNPDGSMDYRYVKKLKLQTYRAFQSLYGESFVVYNPDFQSLKVNEVYTQMADGKKNPSPENAFNEVLPGFSANAPAYNRLREMVITHTGTERNAILNLDYTLHTKKGFYPCLMGNELLSEVEPVKDLTVVIKVPSNATLYFNILNSSSTPVITKEGDFQVYTWKFINLPISTEDNQKGGNDLYPRILFSSVKDRNVLYGDFLKQEAFSFEVNPEMKNRIALLSAENKDKMNILLKLQDKVVNELRLYPVPMKYTGFLVRTPLQTWNSSGGTTIEKAVLLSALLKEAGIEANPVFMIRNSMFTEDFGSLMDVEDVLVKAKIPGNPPLYLSLTSLNAQNLIYCDPERTFVELKKPETRIEKAITLKNKINQTGIFTINDKNQLSGEINLTEDYGTNSYLMFLRDKLKAKSLFGGGLSSSDLKDPEITKSTIEQTTVVISVQKDKALRNDSDYSFLQLPVVTNGIESLGIHLLPKYRNTPLEIASVIEEKNDFTYIIPDKMKPFIPSEKKEIKNAVGSFIFEVKTEGSKVLIHKSIKLEQRLIQPSEYPDFKALMDHWNADRYKEVVFQKTK